MPLNWLDLYSFTMIGNARGGFLGCVVKAVKLDIITILIKVKKSLVGFMPSNSSFTSSFGHSAIIQMVPFDNSNFLIGKLVGVHTFMVPFSMKQPF